MAVKLESFNTSFGAMTFSPDVVSSALKPNEYNAGKNIETNNRAINSVLGDLYVLSSVPGNKIFITSGFRTEQNYWFIVATKEGRWYGLTTSGITNLTPGYDPVTNPDAALTGYSNELSITASWNGNVLFVNDSINPPLYLIPTSNRFELYSNDPESTSEYVWNYNPAWSKLAAGFIRLYSTPNVGSILVAGNLTATTTGNIIVNQPNTVRWSQSFGIDSGPQTWAPTLTNVANELEVPVRGPVIDGFPCGGNFYVCSYWDTVVFQPISYQSTSAPILGVKLLTQGRGLLNENCWAVADDLVYGLDARDIWIFNGSQFNSLGNQRVKDWFYSNLNPVYSYLTNVINNTSKNQIEIYFPNLQSTGMCNTMLAYRYDLDVFQAPRDVSNQIHATEGPRATLTNDPILPWRFNLASRTVVYVQGDTANTSPIEKDITYSFVNGEPIAAEFRRDNITFIPGIPYSAETLIHRILPQIQGTGNITIQVGGANSAGQPATFNTQSTIAVNANQPWITCDQNSRRVITLIANNTSTTDQFFLTGIDWQLTQVSDAR
jgi:hypothetical protein